jgi:hypothetical protein
MNLFASLVITLAIWLSGIIFGIRYVRDSERRITYLSVCLLLSLCPLIFAGDMPALYYFSAVPMLFFLGSILFPLFVYTRPCSVPAFVCAVLSAAMLVIVLVIAHSLSL